MPVGPSHSGEPDEETSLRINRVLRGDLPDVSIRAYLGDCRRMIHTAEVASRVPQCTWGIRRFDAGGFGEVDLIGQIRQLAFVLGRFDRPSRERRNANATSIICRP